MKFRPALAVLLIGTLAACKKEPSPKDTPTAAADDAGSDKKALGGLDLGLDLPGDGGLPGELPEGVDPMGGLGGAPPPPVVTLQVKKPGAEPRSPLVYDFPLGKPSAVAVTVKSSVKEEGPGAGGAPQGTVPIKLDLLLLPKEKGPDGVTKVAVRVIKADLSAVTAKGMPGGAAAQMKAVEGAMAKMAGTFGVSPQGAVKDVAFSSSFNPMTAELNPLVAQTLELLFVQTPPDAVGTGAEWTVTSSPPDGGPSGGTMVATCTLVERGAAGATIKVVTDRKMPNQSVTGPGVPPGLRQEVTGKGAFTVSVKTGDIASKVKGEMETKLTMTDTSQKTPSKRTATVKVGYTVDPIPVPTGASVDAANGTGNAGGPNANADGGPGHSVGAGGTEGAPSPSAKGLPHGGK